jgi:hypothetical protein
MRAQQPGPHARQRGDDSPVAADDVDVVDDGGRWLSPGQPLRLPAGYLMLACGVCVVLAAASYMVGHRRGEAIARAEFEARLRGAGGSLVNDPLQSLEPLDTPGGGQTGLSRPPATSQGSVAPGRGSAAPTGATASRPQSQWGPVAPGADPRIGGLNYWVLAETSREGAERLVEHARSSGLETYAVPAKNGRFRVIALPGFDLTTLSRTSPAVTAVRDQIHRIGETWKRDKRGYSDLRDAYLDKYDG